MYDNFDFSFMQSVHIPVSKGAIHALRFGTGKKLLITFHGFADRADLFRAIVEPLASRYLVYAIDLPYHGQTDWNASYFDQNDLIEIIQSIQSKEQGESISLLGYSLGGRLALSVFQMVRPEVLFLIAPDGIKSRRLLNLTNIPFWVRHLYTFLLHRPSLIHSVIRRLYAWKLITKFIHDFCIYHTNSPERRERIIGTWSSLRYFRIQPKAIKRALIHSKIPTHLFYGTRDEVIPLAGGQWLSKDAPNIDLHLIEEGHLLIDEKLESVLEGVVSIGP